jgi:hypothetical protein
MKKPVKINYRKFIEEYFMVLDRENQVPVPFKLNEVQAKYMEELEKENPEFDGIRDIILKARQQGFSSLILAIFAVDFILRPYSISICISHRKDATELLFRKVKFYLESYIRKAIERHLKSTNQWNEEWKEDTKKATIDHLFPDWWKNYFKSDNKGMLENATNNAMFYIGTAGTKVGGRGGSARNIHFSEAAFYQDTELITAQEIIVGTAQQVPQGHGMIFIESTANGEGNYYHAEWERAMPGGDGSAYIPRFFGWQEFYTKDWVEEKRKEFPSIKLWMQEYPGSPDEAFISSGEPFFDVMMLDEMVKAKAVPVEYGRLMPDGNFL